MVLPFWCKVLGLPAESAIFHSCPARPHDAVDAMGRLLLPSRSACMSLDTVTRLVLVAPQPLTAQEPARCRAACVAFPNLVLIAYSVQGSIPGPASCTYKILRFCTPS